MPRKQQLPMTLYIHFPWCVKKCPYCDFNSHIKPTTIPEDTYISRLVVDLNSRLANIQHRTFTSIYLGGGTPSLFSAKSIAQLLEKISKLAKIKPTAEISMETNPGTLTKKTLLDYRDSGINRLSIGAQSFSDCQLKALGRIHNKTQIIDCVQTAQEIGCDNINLDIMFGLPEQSIEDALNDLQTAIDLAPQHISWYQLTIEPNTYFYKHKPKLADEDTLWFIQQKGIELLTKNNYRQYEISAFAKPKFKCKHNLNYWLFGDYIGIGAGAHSKITDLNTYVIKRTMQPNNPIIYMKNDSRAQENILEEKDLILEYMLNTLRLYQPIPLGLFLNRTNLPISKLTYYLKQAMDAGFISISNETIQTTAKGKQFLDDLLLLFTE